MHSSPRHSLHATHQSQVKVAVLADTMPDRASLSWQNRLIAGVAIAAIFVTYFYVTYVYAA